jgi:hypothetical protein
MKTAFKDAVPLRQPNGTWQVKNAARWFEKLLGIPKGSVVFLRADGKQAEAKETVGSLRAKVE